MLDKTPTRRARHHRHNPPSNDPNHNNVNPDGRCATTSIFSSSPYTAPHVAPLLVACDQGSKEAVAFQRTLPLSSEGSQQADLLSIYSSCLRLLLLMKCNQSSFNTRKSTKSSLGGAFDSSTIARSDDRRNGPPCVDKQSGGRKVQN